MTATTTPTDASALGWATLPPPARLSLVVVSGQARGLRIPVTGTVRIGKAADNDLIVPDASVSRHHCEIYSDLHGISVRDLNSTHHTRIGQSKIQRATLEPGSTVTIGDIRLLLTADTEQLPILPSTNAQFGLAVGPSPAMRGVFGLLEQFAPTDATILLGGETGTGKDVVGRSIHQLSPRKDAPFVVIDCGAISYHLIESEFFGHERGAFTGAVQARAGVFESVGAGTLFLDEVGELPLDLQPKLLRILETGEFRRVGGNRTLRSQARILAASKRDLKQEVEQGRFREDLYFRLAVVPITIPPLRDRREDIPALVENFLAQAKRKDSRLEKLRVSRETLAALKAHDWPGNVRELRNVLDRALYLASATGEEQLHLVDLGATSLAPARRTMVPRVRPSLRVKERAWEFNEKNSYRQTKAAFEGEFERKYVTWLLDAHGGNLSAAARAAQMDRKYLHGLARKHGLRD